MVISSELTEKAIEDSLEHFCRLNGVGRDDFQAHLTKVKAEWMQLNQLHWQVDWGTFTSLVVAAEQKREAD